MLTAPLIVALPITDRHRAYRFYAEGLGLGTVGEIAEDGVPEPLQVVVNDGVHLMLIPTGGFGWTIAGRSVAETGASECQLCLSFPTKEDVTAFLAQARDAGAFVVREPQDQPWGYVANFADPDGHLWMLRAAN